MGILDKIIPGRKKDNTEATAAEQAPHSTIDPKVLAEESGPVGKVLIAAVEKAASMQAGLVESYVDWLRSKNPEATPAQLQEILDKHFTRLVTGTGGAAGSAAAIPGIGFITGALAIGTESLVFIDAAAVYALASAKIRGANIQDPARREALVMMSLSGASGSAVVDAVVGGGSPMAMISRMSVKNVGEVNNRLFRMAAKRIGKTVRKSFLGKLMPLGIGAVLGSIANRKIAARMIARTNEALDALPASFDTPAPTNVEEPKVITASAEK
ncbi:hypothetical protein ACXM2N_04695 [Corynebacterium sp. ZY180755]